MLFLPSFGQILNFRSTAHAGYEERGTAFADGTFDGWGEALNGFLGDGEEVGCVVAGEAGRRWYRCRRCFFRA